LTLRILKLFRIKELPEKGGMMMKQALLLATILGVLPAIALGDGPKDNLPDQVRRIPALGVEVPAADRAELERGLKALQASIDQLKSRKDASTKRLLPDVQIFHSAVQDALEYQEFFVAGDIGRGKSLLKTGQERADQLLAGKSPWTTQTGLVVRGYVSRIDGSVQPYGLVVPASYTPATSGRYRLDLWFHGRGEPLSEVNFLDQRQKQVGQFGPADTIVLHPYGRYCNAFKFAGEIDVLEALDSVRGQYRIDDERISVRGFSMGGAACWQFAVHYADRWFAANPGAGFAETAEFLKVFQNEPVGPPSYERDLWHWYDCPDYAENLYQCPTVAYSGELDSQKQAADIMSKALARAGLPLRHIIGPGTKHQYHPAAAAEVEEIMATLAQRGRVQQPWSKLRFSTYTLRYNRMNWVTIDGLGEHWKAATVRAEPVNAPSSGAPASGYPALRTTNVTDLSLSIPPGQCDFDLTGDEKEARCSIDGQLLPVERPRSDRSWSASFYREGETWKTGKRPGDELRKRHGLQGPIDDAFMDSFVFVRPTGDWQHPAIKRWATAEMERAIEHWRRQFRGHARVKDDTAITAEDIASSNLVLWGEPSSNAILGKISGRLPIAWGDAQIKVGSREFSSPEHALIAIYPNPLNPQRYVVLNSSFTYREYDYLNNARQVPKLPDWAVIDTRTPPDSRYPGKIAAADFFDEQWKLRASRE
jgi:hypothetical protein